MQSCGIPGRGWLWGGRGLGHRTGRGAQGKLGEARDTVQVKHENEDEGPPGGLRVTPLHKGRRGYSEGRESPGIAEADGVLEAGGSRWRTVGKGASLASESLQGALL